MWPSPSLVSDQWRSSKSTSSLRPSSGVSPLGPYRRKVRLDQYQHVQTKKDSVITTRVVFGCTLDAIAWCGQSRAARWRGGVHDPCHEWRLRLVRAHVGRTQDRPYVRDVRTFVSGTHLSGAVSGQAERAQRTGVRRRLRQNHLKKAGVGSAD